MFYIETGPSLPKCFLVTGKYHLGLKDNEIDDGPLLKNHIPTALSSFGMVTQGMIK